jgi:hypothetical protein
MKNLLRVRKSKNNTYEIDMNKTFGTYRTVWFDSRYEARQHGTNLLKSLLLSDNKNIERERERRKLNSPFPNPFEMSTTAFMR